MPETGGEGGREGREGERGGRERGREGGRKGEREGGREGEGRGRVIFGCGTHTMLYSIILGYLSRLETGELAVLTISARR